MSMMVLAADEVLTVKRGEDDFLFIDKHSRDVICAANSFLVILRDQVSDDDTKRRIDRVIGAFTDILYKIEDE